jgi:superfamily II DNA or RNA helicase
MAKLENLTQGVLAKGIYPNQNVTVIDARWHGSNVIELTYKTSDGQPHIELLTRDRESTLEVVQAGRPWNFDGDGALLRLVSEAHRIRLAHLFDPMLAVHSSLVEPLPHQITAVYGEMLKRQPLRFLLADDPGAGKTIMAGLLIRELLIRGDVQRCLIVCPGSLAVQWQDELFHKFHMPFEILTNDRLTAARSGNALAEMSLVIARLDKLSRDEDLQDKLRNTDWDLIVCDEAHKMAATFYGKEIKTTKRYRLGKLLSSISRHFLLMTATPHNGKNEDFQLFMSLLDSDRFEGRFREGAPPADTSDLMRRMVKEDLLRFDGTKLFPERIAQTVTYPLSDLEGRLYRRVTEYVREEFNRADKLASDDGRKGTVGFALTILQRRLASSPEAIYQSLKRRREKLQKRLREEELQRGFSAEINFMSLVDMDDIDDELEDIAADELEKTEEALADRATAALTVAELKMEIDQLEDLEKLALEVRRSGRDRKWEELSNLLQDQQMFNAEGSRRKLVIFTEHRDTLNYLANRISSLLSNADSVVAIHGGMSREDRKKAENAFKQDVTVHVLLATDAAGEGINLQRAHLMVNYDLPWNVNRLEQRFGRIHRIGQTEVCRLWNLLAEDTREGDVYLTLLRKLEQEQRSLGGKVFDVLGQAIAGKELRELLIEAVRYGDSPEVKAKLNQVVTDRLDHQRIQDLIEEQALAHDAMDASKIQKVREDMERAEARKLQPYFISSFFLEAFEYLGGTTRQREPRRFEIKHVPAILRQQSQRHGLQEPIGRSYERICFEKDLINVQGKPPATFVCPGHPLLDAVLDTMLDQHQGLLRQGAVLIDPGDSGEVVRCLVYLEHTIQDARLGKNGQRHSVSRRMQYVEIGQDGTAYGVGYAPYLDYRPCTTEEKSLLEPVLEGLELLDNIEDRAMEYAIAQLVTQHLQEVKSRKEELVQKTIKAVKERLTREINYWDAQATKLKAQELQGKANAKLNSQKARQRADDLEMRLGKRLTELEEERQLSPLPPLIVGGALVVPIGLLERLAGDRTTSPSLFAIEKKRVELAAMAAVMAAELRLGHVPKDVSAQKCGYDIESLVPATGHLRFIEVKGRIEGSETVTVTRNEILYALNKPDNFVLALVSVPAETTSTVSEKGGFYLAENNSCSLRYVHKPFLREPDTNSCSVNYSWKEMWQAGENPS